MLYADDWCLDVTILIFLLKTIKLKLNKKLMNILVVCLFLSFSVCLFLLIFYLFISLFPASQAGSVVVSET